MRMKHAYPALLALLLTLALAGCRQEPLPESGDVIRFSVGTAGVSSALTKAESPALPDDQLVMDGNTVSVWSKLSTDKGATWKELFSSLTLTKGEKGWDYNTASRYYWNRGAQYQFRGVFTGIVTDKHDADITSGSPDKIEVKYSGGYDLMVAATSVLAGKSQSANLQFLHACSAVRFYFVDPNDTDNYSMKSFKLKNVAKTGTLAFTNDGATDLDSDQVPDVNFTEWKRGDLVADVYSWPTAAMVDAARPVPGTKTALTDWFYFVPQNLDDSAEVEFSFKAGDQTFTIESKLKDLCAQWIPGKAYTYLIKVDPKTIELTVEWTDWIGVEHDYGQVG